MIYSILVSLAACLQNQFDIDGSPQPCFLGVVPGDAPEASRASGCDNGRCGMAWVRMVNLYPATSVGVVDETPRNCGVGIGFDIEVGVFRCMTVSDTRGNMIPKGSLESHTEQGIKDALSIHKAILCCDELAQRDKILGVYTPAGPMGGIVGGAWTLSVAL